jgi:uncharacterized membrane protein YtjA (UPF0391 family)
MLAYLLAIIFVIIAVVYFLVPAESLPTFMPGYAVGSAHVHAKHAVIAIVIAIILFIIGWFAGRARR